ncbi:MAG: fimbrillin family protein [Paramuribaculum sp.]|nr:fimbrillin family protein [Paramuribaculum sp.]
MNKILTIFAASALFVSCTSELPEGIAVDGNTLRVSVQDRGFSGSRTAEEDLTTVFTEGDKIGLYAVKDGAIVPGIDNVCYQAVEAPDGIAWVSTGDETLYDVEGITYYAYYPYTENLEGSVDLSATDEDAFFADVVSNWTVLEDQYDYADYTASDLMTAKGVISDGGLSFVMEHRMSLLRFSFPAYKYVFTNTPAIPDYIMGEARDIDFKVIMPYENEGKEYRFIVNPASETTVAGIYTWSGQRYSWEVTPTVSAGEVRTINVDPDRNQVIEHNLQIGDFFLSDGNLVSKDASISDLETLDIVGIVYNIDPDHIGAADKEALGGVAHGSVMALRDVYNPYGLCAWSSEQNDESEIGLPKVEGENNTATARMFEECVDGYETLCILKDKRPEKYIRGIYEVFLLTELFLSDNENIDLLKAYTTGWYVPAVGQWLYIVRNLANAPCSADQAFGPSDLIYWKPQGDNAGALSRLNACFEKLSAGKFDPINTSRWYWTASSTCAEYAYYVQVTDGIQGLNAFSCFANPKTSWTYVRPVLTF